VSRSAWLRLITVNWSVLFAQTAPDPVVKVKGTLGSSSGLVGEICGSPIRPNGRRKLGSRSPRTRCGIARLQLFLFVAGCLSYKFALSG
jgi:hypothetical protein